jgi:hypothetical protein
MDNPSKNFGLSAAEWETQLNRFWNGDEALIHLIFDHQFHKAVRHLQYKCQAQQNEAEEAALDTLWIFKKMLQKDAFQEAAARSVKYDKLNDLFNMVARRHYYKTIGKLDVRPMLDGIEQSIGEQDADILMLENYDKHLYDIKKLNESLAQLPTDKQTLINQRIRDEKTFKEIADSFNPPKKENTVIQAFKRALQELVSIFKQDYVEDPSVFFG